MKVGSTFPIDSRAMEVKEATFTKMWQPIKCNQYKISKIYRKSGEDWMEFKG